MPEVATVLQIPRLWPQKIGKSDQIKSGKNQKSSTPVGQSNQKKTPAMVARSHKDGEEACTCVNVETQIKWKLQGQFERINLQ